jgi:flagella synthesis protein FlgN
MSTIGTKLLANLNLEQVAIDQLVELIKHEQETLVAANIEAIEPITKQKANLIAKLADQSNKRHLILATANYQADDTGMQAWIEQNDAREVNEAWQALMQQVKTAKLLNQTNSLLVNTHLARTQNALNILHGSSKSGSVYGPNGQTSSSTKARPIVSG